MSKNRPVKKVVQLILEKGSNCAYCLRHLEWEEVSLDHIVPKIRGGKDNIENLAISCKSCNSSKGTKTLEEFNIHKSLREILPAGDVAYSETGLMIRTRTKDLKENMAILHRVASRLGVLDL